MPKRRALLYILLAPVMFAHECQLIGRDSARRCVRNVNFGCAADGHSMWVNGKCRGEFECGGGATVCLSNDEDASTNCSCSGKQHFTREINPKRLGKREINPIWLGKHFMRHACDVKKEPIFVNMLLGMLKNDEAPPGGVIDAGAHIGTETCLLSAAAPERTIHAIEPMLRNVYRIRQRRLPNAIVMHGSLGNASLMIKPTAGSMAFSGQMFSPARRSLTAKVTPFLLTQMERWFQQYRIDDLYSGMWKGETLGLAHLDVEGQELDALQGAEKTIARDAPIITTELFVHMDHNYSSALVRFMAQRGYRTFLVDEVCGSRMDCRNLIHLPDRWRSRFGGSKVLADARASSQLVPVDEHSVLQFAYPCCARGGRCCPSISTEELGTGKSLQGSSEPAACCTEKQVVREELLVAREQQLAAGMAQRAERKAARAASDTRRRHGLRMGV